MYVFHSYTQCGNVLCKSNFVYLNVYRICYYLDEFLCGVIFIIAATLGCWQSNTTRSKQRQRSTSESSSERREHNHRIDRRRVFVVILLRIIPIWISSIIWKPCAIIVPPIRYIETKIVGVFYLIRKTHRLVSWKSGETFFAFCSISVCECVRREKTLSLYPPSLVYRQVACVCVCSTRPKTPTYIVGLCAANIVICKILCVCVCVCVAQRSVRVLRCALARVLRPISNNSAKKPRFNFVSSMPPCSVIIVSVQWESGRA